MQVVSRCGPEQSLSGDLSKERWARELHVSGVFNCSGLETGNMEVLHYCGGEAQKTRWLKPLMVGGIRSALLMTDPQRRLLRRHQHHQHHQHIRCQGDEYVINRR